ncbi:S9 family peptidase [Chondrinema litorale]|uniref:S9 family peptidase n=1 Tax=Chondrinema litorale TaxID=2994555 RepID=UPI002543EE57|nr:S9 family peptidase [Chondrinema litorale]UZR94869.1 S9 family peptidase [Chondrinema litorale]
MTQSAISQKRITIDDVFGKNTFSPKRVSGVNWMNDGKYYSAINDNNVVKVDVTTGQAVETIFDGDLLPSGTRLSAYQLSADEKKILILTQREMIYRRSFTADYTVFDLETKKISPLSEGGKQSYATFSPDGTKVAFVRENNLFYVNLDDMSEVQVTDDGKFNHIINGSTDWVYEEEFGFVKAFFWSPDSKKIAYYKFDESEVPEYNMQLWNHGALYPQDYRFKYPKAGEKNSTIAIKIYHLNNKQIVDVPLGSETDIYIPRVMWTKNPDLLSVRRMNRLQNQIEILHADAKSGKSEVVYTEKSDTYIDINYCNDLTYLSDGEHFVRTSEKDGYKHIYVHNMDGSEALQLTKGEWEVTKLVGISDGKKPIAYYISTEVSPLERHLYRIDLKGKKKEKLSAKSGMYSVDMSPDFQYFIETYNAVDAPGTYTLYKAPKNESIKVLEDNSELKSTLEEYDIVTKEFFTISLDNDVELNAYMLKPTDFDSTKQYPLLVYQYSGPGSQNVSKGWSGGHFFMHQYLVQQGYIVAVVDPRGTGFKGKAFKHITYKQLGKYETEDQIAAAKYMSSLDYIDASRIGIWGWSYGGYMSSLCIMKGADVFKTAVAMAPVTTWRFYDSIYTERYLQRPQDNASGYDDNSPINHVDKLKGNFLLVHGTGDDNVHFQNSVALQDALIQSGKQFSSFYYPDKNHGLRGGNDRGHFYQLFANYIMNNL